MEYIVIFGTYNSSEIVVKVLDTDGNIITELDTDKILVRIVNDKIDFFLPLEQIKSWSERTKTIQNCKLITLNIRWNTETDVIVDDIIVQMPHPSTAKLLDEGQSIVEYLHEVKYRRYSV
jgi:hypothetical protein